MLTFKPCLALCLLLLGGTLSAAPRADHIVTRSAAAVFAADGANTGGTEYAATDRVDLTGSNFMEAQVFLHRYRDPATGNEELRIYFSVHDITQDPSDRIDFYFDRLNDGGALNDPTLAEDVLIRVTRGDCNAPCEVRRLGRDGTGLFSGTGTAVNLANAQVLQNSAGEYAGLGAPYNDGWTGELVLTPADLGWGYFPQVAGFLVRARSNGQNSISAANPTPSSPLNPVASYPTIAGLTVSDTTPNDWDDLLLRYPIDYAVVLDNSGSMLATDGLTDTRWIRAKRAANLFVATLGLFKDPAITDQVGASQYSWTCGNNNVAADLTGAIAGIGTAALVNVPNPPTGTDAFLSAANADPLGNNCTPIKRGVEYALTDQLGYPGVDPKRDRITILLSDGFHNMPSGDVPFDPAADFSSAEKDFMQVRTVALGPDGSAGTDLLSDLSTAFSGTLSHEAKFNNALNFADLLEAYLETLQDPLAVNQVDPGTGVGCAVGNYCAGAPDKLVFIGVWNTAANASNLTVTGSTQGAVVGTVSNTEIGYAAVTVNNPTANDEWSFTSAAGGTLPDQQFVLADLRIRAQFLTEQKVYGAGEPILLQARLKDGPDALLGAEATVEIARPGESLGNLLSTIQKNCEPDDNGTDGIFVDRERQQAITRALFGNAKGAVARASAAVPAAQAQTQSGDPPPGRYALAAAYFDQCNKPGLDRIDLPGVALTDDGLNGDAVPGDGIYSLSYTDTDLEGTYTFRFHVRGTTTDSVGFTRTRTYSQYVRIKPTPQGTGSTIQLGQVVNGQQQAQVILTPKDGLGNFVGPGFAYTMKVSTNTGLLVGPLIDQSNGRYVQHLQYLASGPKPVVKVELPGGQGVKVVDFGRPSGPRGPRRWLLWLLIFIILILLILLFLCWRRKR